MLLIYLAIGAVALAIGVVATIITQRNMAHSRARIIIEEARSEAEVLKKTSLLEAEQERVRKAAEADKNINQRMSKIQSREGQIKQRELQLNQQQGENQRMRNELDQLQGRLNDQLAITQARQDELDALKSRALEELEHVSGLSCEEAKEKLVESLKDEAKTAAQSYINDIMDEAKLTANK